MSCGEAQRLSFLVALRIYIQMAAPALTAGTPRKLFTGKATLINIFVNIFDGLHRAADLNVDVTLVFSGQIRVVWNDGSVVESYVLTVDPFRFNIRRSETAATMMAS